MITMDAASPLLANGTHEEVESFVASVQRGGSAPEAADLSPELREAVTAILDAPGGIIELVTSRPMGYSTHHLTLARSGFLRRSRGTTESEDLAVHPTTVLPAVILRLAAIAPVEALNSTVELTVAESTSDALFSADIAERSQAWSAVIGASRALPAAENSGLEDAEPVAVRIIRRRPDSVHTATTLQVRGRYLAQDAAASSLTGTTPTGATRSLMGALTAR